MSTAWFDDPTQSSFVDTPRKTQVGGFRRIAKRMLIEGLRDSFSAQYDRDREFSGLRISTTYPLTQVDYPTIIVEFAPRVIQHAGVAQLEVFPDDNGIIRQWGHARFEGTVEFAVHALSPLSRDLLADALSEILLFGVLDLQLRKFFWKIYNNQQALPTYVQLSLNVDQIDNMGDTATLAPWQPEDVMVYQNRMSLDVHGGFYNLPNAEWDYVSSVDIDPYPAGDITVFFGVP